MKKIILISGKAENGKTTTAELLKSKLESLGNKVIITRYAYYLKDLAARYCGWDGTKDKKGRELLQQLGTDIIRQKLNKPNFHVGRICEDIEICQDYIDYVIIDDARFPNEIYFPKAMFGDKVVSLRINRTIPGTNNELYNSSLTEEQKHHISETALDDFQFDFTIFASDKMVLKSFIDNEFISFLGVEIPYTTTNISYTEKDGELTFVEYK